ncbi:hypothetical protein ACQPYA_20510 [Micromonospora sp. CA-263727]|uniref:hypothetical protein n=1 Tax=Micromonospora sp. CA-263727 TaxID=3239967 RepID=UPI003D94C191
MRLSRIIMALAVGLAVVAVPTAAGAAQPQPSPSVSDTPQPPPYPPVLASLTVNRPTIYLGESVILTGRNFLPREWVTITISRTPLAAPVVGTVRSNGDPLAMTPVAFQAIAPLRVRADANGSFSRRYTPTETGLLTFTATGEESGRTASTQLRVLHKKKPHLPVTGSSLETPMKVGGGLVAAGAVLLLGTVLWRRRSRFGAGGTH